MSKIYSTLYKSVVRAVQDAIDDISSTASGQVRYWAWEGRGDEDQMPHETLIGVNGFSFEENQGQWLVRFGLTISTVDDANLFDEADMIDVLHDHFGEKQKIMLRDPDDGETFNELSCVHFEVLPMTATQVRNYRSIGVEVLRTGTDG